MCGPRGAQVDWIEVQSYLELMLYFEGVAVQTDVQARPHLVDTAILYAQCCSSSAAMSEAPAACSHN